MATWESSVEERPGYTKTEKSRMLLSPATRLGIRMTCTYEYIINICLTMYMYIATLYKYFYITQANPSLKWFITCSLSQMLNLSSAREFVRIPWNHFSGANGNVVVHDNPNCSEFMKNTQALHVINGLHAPKKGNCRGGDMDKCKENWCTPLPKCRRLNTH